MSDRWGTGQTKPGVVTDVDQTPADELLELGSRLVDGQGRELPPDSAHLPAFAFTSAEQKPFLDR